MIHCGRFITKPYVDILVTLVSDAVIVNRILDYFVPAPLKSIYPHSRDSRIRFYDEILLPGEIEPRLHLYIVDGDANSYVSCTTFIHQFFGHFDADLVIGNMMRGRNWERSQYFGMTSDQIKAAWELNRDQASKLGTEMHLNLEHFYNGIPVSDAFLLSPEWEQFQRYLAANPGQLPGSSMLNPLRTEVEVFDVLYKISGSIDMLYWDPARPGYVIIADWKRSKEIKWSDRNRGKAPLEHIEDCNGMHYSLQVNLYKYLLEKNYGVKVSRMFLLRLHPNADEFEQIEIEDMQAEIQLMLDNRLAQLSQ